MLPLSQPLRRRYEDYSENQVPRPLQLLVELLDQHKNFELVLSSSWRIDFDIERARELFPARHRLRLIGVTPIIGTSANQQKLKKKTGKLKINRIEVNKLQRKVYILPPYIVGHPKSCPATGRRLY